MHRLPPLKRHNHGRKVNFNDRPFVAWDGEGITYPGDIQQSYVLLGSSSGDQLSKPSLATVDCLELLLAAGTAESDSIHVGFAFQYDVNMILKDLSKAHLEELYANHWCKWKGYRINYFPNKWFTVRDKERRIRLYDVFSFFQSSFVKACEKFLGEDDPELVRIREGKQARSSFTYDQLEPFIIPYWQAELRLLVRLMHSLRDDLTKADLKVVSWHGPGAVANTTFQKFNIHLAKEETPEVVQRAAQFAYAGGRFEQFQCGHYPGTVWEYDINSAYPSAIALLPNLRRGTWAYTDTFEPDSFGVWHVQYSSAPDFLKAQPFFFRDDKGRVSFPPTVSGWYWTPEAALMPDAVLHGWVFRSDTDARPFRFVEDMYNIRLKWKRQGNSVERALKLALNSLYGKMAQRVGGTEDYRPKWHQLEWAGFVTSHCRAKLYQAMLQNPSAIIAMETDAVFSTEPLDLSLGEKLGEWDETKFDWITYVQSGFYFAGRDSETIERYRGFDRGSVRHSEILLHMETAFQSRQQSSSSPVDPCTGTTTRFVGMGAALHTSSVWRSWETGERAIKVGGGGKRDHVARRCQQCRQGVSMADGLHRLSVTTPGGRSMPHKIPWNEGIEWEGRLAEEFDLW